MLNRFLFLIFFVSGICFSQSDDSLQVYYHDEIVISASKYPKPASDIARSISVIDQQQIDNSVNLSAADLLAGNSAINIIGNRQNPGSVQNLYLRGVNANNTAVLIDGMRISDPSTPDNALNMSEISLMDVERVEIIKGPHSSLFGSSALGGVINFITHKNQQPGLNIDLYSHAGTFGKNTFDFTQNLVLNYSFENGFFSSFNIYNSNIRGMDATIDTVSNPAIYNKRDRDDFYKTDWVIKTGYLNNNWDVLLSYRNSDQRSHIDDGAFNDDDNYVVDFDRSIFSGRVVYNFNSNWRWSAQLGLSNMVRKAVDDSSIVDFAGNYDGSYLSDRYSADILTGESTLLYKSQFIKILSGFSFYREEMSAENYLYSNSSFGIFESYNNLDSLSLSADTYAIFSHIDINGSLIDKKFEAFKLALGGRLSNHSTFGNNFTYEISPSMLITKEFLAYISYATGFNAPSLYRLYSPDAYYTSGITRGNKDLQPELSENIELGLKYTFVERQNIRLAFFQNKIEDVHEYVYLWDSSVPINELGTDFSRDDFRGDTYINGGDLLINGIELSFQFEPFENLVFNGNLNWLDGEQKFKPLEGQDHIRDNRVQLYNNGQFLNQNISVEGLPRRSNTVNIFTSYRAADDLLFSVAYHFVDKKDDVYYNTLILPFGALDERRVESYSLVDFKLKYDITEQFSTFVRLDNIFDEEYREIYGFTTRGRSAYLGLRISY